MPASARGVSNTRSVPNSSCRPSVTRNTPPSFPMSSPRTRARGSSASDWRRASLRALTMVTSTMFDSFRRFPREAQDIVPLPSQVGWQVVEHPLEHLLHRARTGGDHARPHLGGELLGLAIDRLEEVLIRRCRGREPGTIPIQGIQGLPLFDSEAKEFAAKMRSGVIASGP